MHRLEPELEGAEHDVDVANGVAAEEGAAAGALGKGHLHVLDRGKRLLHLLRPVLLRLGRHHAVPRREQLVAGVGRPEAGGGTLVGVGRCPCCTPKRAEEHIGQRSKKKHYS